jgi:antitoxin component YwqK of YwqJK toxin-antitoxin module
MKYIVSLFIIGFFLPICAQTPEIPSPPKCKKIEGFECFENDGFDMDGDIEDILYALVESFTPDLAQDQLNWCSSLGKDYTGAIKNCNEKNVDLLLQFKNGSIEGVQRIWADYYAYAEWNVQNSRLEGVQKQWYDSEYSEYNYKNGQKEGVQTFYEEGILSSLKTYKNGSKHGISKSWDDDSNLESEENYKDGKLDGWQRFYASDGSILGEANLIDGNGTLTVNYENGQVDYVKTYVNGIQEGLQMSWYKNGQMKDSTVRSDDVVDYGKSWYENGQLESYDAGSFIRYWDENGNLTEEDFPGKGIFRAYYASGQLKSEESQFGMEEKSFFENGQLKRHYIEEDDNGYNVEKEYYENGQLKRSYKEHYNLDTLEEQCWDMDGNEINCN